jgi:hypothetical protein
MNRTLAQQSFATVAPEAILNAIRSIGSVEPRGSTRQKLVISARIFSHSFRVTYRQPRCERLMKFSVIAL